nr:MAG TPA_asm: hypothetical protein [Caudoviricetes sp.]
MCVRSWRLRHDACYTLYGSGLNALQAFSFLPSNGFHTLSHCWDI